MDHDYQQVSEARCSIGQWFEFYNNRRPHQGLGYRTPAAVYRKEEEEMDKSGTLSPTPGV
ncbi:MAG: transposase [Bryobacterales bacterium]|nr:transposase [Bryobacterales bacterium]